MLLFQQFCLQNPDFLSAKCRLKDYYAEDYQDAREDSVTEPESDSGKEDDESEMVATPTITTAKTAVTPIAQSPGPTRARVTKKEPTDKSPKGPSKRKGDSPTRKSNKRFKTNDAFIGRKIAKKFPDGEVYVGSVTKCRTIQGWKCWWIDYEDGDSEELEYKELQATLRLFEKLSN